MKTTTFWCRVRVRGLAGSLVLICLLAASARWASATPPDPGDNKPPYTPLPPKGAGTTGLILMAHGWVNPLFPDPLTDGPHAWANALRTRLATELYYARTQGNWDIVSYDWVNVPGPGGKQLGALTAKPQAARTNALAVGDFLRAEILKRNYTSIHVIGHSAGTWLAHHAFPLVNQNGTFPTVQCTFFDAYAPLPAPYLGAMATFAVQYVDTREDKFFGNPTNTNATLTNAYNLDITPLDPRAARTFAFGGHAWPHEWYLVSATAPPLGICGGWGFNRTIERGTMPTFGNVIDGRQLVRGRRDALPVPGPAPGPGAVRRIVRRTDADFTGGQFSIDGANLIGANHFSLSADLVLAEPEAWIEKTVTLSDSVNLLEFRFNFSGNGQGWLTTWVNDSLVYHADQRYAHGVASIPDSDWVLLDETLAPGTHKIAFRLDPYSDDPSRDPTGFVDVSDVKLGYADTTLVITAVSAVEPHRMGLSSAVPNPSSEVASFRYTLSAKGRVTAEVFDVAGRLVRTLIRNHEQPAGMYDVRWDGRGSAGIDMPAGVYFFRLTTPAGESTRKVVRVK